MKGDVFMLQKELRKRTPRHEPEKVDEAREYAPKRLARKRQKPFSDNP